MSVVIGLYMTLYIKMSAIIFLLFLFLLRCLYWEQVKPMQAQNQMQSTI